VTTSLRGSFSRVCAVVLALTASARAADGPTVPRPPIVAREVWGSKPHPVPEARRQTPAFVTLHHAGVPWRKGRKPEEFLQSLQSWGQNRPTLEKPPMDTYWPDLPYHFMIAPDGRIFEARPVEYEPESNTKYDLQGHLGVEMMGDFDSERPSPAQLRSCVALTAWLCATYGIDTTKVRGHCDVVPGATTCPGKDFYRYLQDGSFRTWVNEVLHGRVAAVAPGPALPDGPTTGVPDGAP